MQPSPTSSLSFGRRVSPLNKTMKTVVELLAGSNATESGDNLFRFDDLGGAIPRNLSPIRWAETKLSRRNEWT